MIKEQIPTIARKIWGGKKLLEMKALEHVEGLLPIGETLEIHDSTLPYLAKFIDTSDELSIQVHPGDEYAKLHENSLGKTECWVILSASVGAGIYLGLKSHVTKDVLKAALLKNKDINELLNFYPVKRGDFFFVPSGSIHAIGKNITLAEVQQNSGITYRVWDWERLDEQGLGRELHIEKSLDVINFDQAYNVSSYFQNRSDLFKHNGLVELCEHPNFKLYILNQKKGETFKMELKNLKRSSSILNLNGDITVNQKMFKSFMAATLIDESLLQITAIEDGSILIIL